MMEAHKRHTFVGLTHCLLPRRLCCLFLFISSSNQLSLERDYIIFFKNSVWILIVLMFNSKGQLKKR
uniref:Putative secreted peptide n=1 Tax=Anopheles braziliensis TaxID=58242 RepID=A0A2M3ZWB0_9DIPT